MTKLLHLTLYLVLPSLVLAQNLIPNPSFEHTHIDVYSMMDSGHEFGRAVKHWDTPNLASSDLVSPRFRTPKFEPIPAHTGKNMAGLVIHGDFWSEYVRVKLNDTLQVGAEYYVEFWLAYCRDYHKDDAKRFLNPHFGALLDERFFEKTDKVLAKKPQVFSAENIELVPNKWVKVSATITATKEATHLYIGQFYEAAVNNPILLGYYYIDDVRVERFSDVSTIFTPKETAPDGLNNIYFETDKYNLLSPSFESLDKVITYLKRSPSLRIQINGHTDNEGEKYHNKELSDNRAKAVYDYLVQNGVNPKRLTSKGFGSSQPVATNGSEIGRQENRRVEFLASNALTKNTSLDKVDVAEADLSYTFSKPNMTVTQKQKIGQYSTWQCNRSKKRKTPDLKAKNLQSGYLRKDAKEYILKRSANEQLVLFNDSQEHPQTRAFFMSMLKDFHQQGFRYIGMEGLDYLDSQLNTRGYPSINSGGRTDEPMYGELIRTAQQMGFTVFPYRAKKEEIGKAKNILSRNNSLSKDKHNLTLSAINWAQAMNINRQIKKLGTAKILIYAHGQNIREQNMEGVRYMGAWLQEFSHINPLTIEQGMMNERCFDNEYPLYYTANPQKPLVFARNNDVLIKKESDKSCYDIQIYHPRTRYENKRPLWKNTFQNKQIQVINLDKYKMKLPCLVIAYHANEDAEIAIPADIVEAKNGNRSPSLLLAKGKYTLVLRDKEKRKKLEIVVL